MHENPVNEAALLSNENAWPADHVERWPVEKLIPYARATEKFDIEVDHAKSILNKYGWRQPIVVNNENVMVAGHIRYQAAIELGWTDVPVVFFSELPASLQRNGIKDVFCEDCGIEFYVRKDKNPPLCKRCGSVKGGKLTGSINRVATHPCKNCGSPIKDSSGDTYCSIDCRKKDKRIDRVCKYCGDVFQVYKSALKTGTNTSGNFCSRQCYEQWLCNTERVKHYGVSWKKIRQSVIKKYPFCAICGTTKNLQVHHIVPYNITNDNRDENLIPLCVKHHKKVESITHDIEMVEDNHDRMLFVLNNMLRSQQQATLAEILNLLRTNS
jgi:hypothetical protein